MEFIGLIPCAGKGSRLALPFSKEMYPDVRKPYYSPIINNTIQAMKIAGIKHIVFTINPGKVDLLKYLGNGNNYSLNFTYCVHPEPRSLPESINEAYHVIKNKTVVFAMPDTIVTPPNYLKILCNKHDKNKKSSVTLGCFFTKKPQKFGMVDFNETTVVNIWDKPASTSLKWMWGAMVWNANFTEDIRKFIKNNKKISINGELILSNALNSLISQKKVYCHLFSKGTYKDLGTYDEILAWLDSP